MNPYKEILRKFFSEYVSALRKRRGLTQEQMAEKLRITGRAYSDLERGIYCFSAVALVFLLLMLEEGEIKELLSPLRDEIEKVEGRGGVGIHGNGGHIRAFALSWPICGKHSLFSRFVCGLSDDTAASPDAVCRMVAVPGSCRTLSHLHFQRETQRLRCSRPGMGNEKRSAEIHYEVSLEAGASSFGVYCHSCRLHQERRCSVNLLQYHVLRKVRNNRHAG